MSTELVDVTPGAYQRNGSTSSSSSAGSRRSSTASFFRTIGHKIAEHHRDVNAAYETYYGAGYHRKPSGSEITTPRSGSEATDSTRLVDDAERRPSTWERVKRHAKEHHESVESAHRAVYGAGDN